LLTALNKVNNDISFIKLFNLEFDFSFKSPIAIERVYVYVGWIVDIPDNNDFFFSKSIDGGQTFNTTNSISHNPSISYETMNVIDIFFGLRLLLFIIMYMFHGQMVHEIIGKFP
jgi:hypothetical protein